MIHRKSNENLLLCGSSVVFQETQKSASSKSEAVTTTENKKLFGLSRTVCALLLDGGLDAVNWRQMQKNNGGGQQNFAATLNSYFTDILKPLSALSKCKNGFVATMNNSAALGAQLLER